jgi:hypothetical protein
LLKHLPTAEFPSIYSFDMAASKSFFTWRGDCLSICPQQNFLPLLLQHGSIHCFLRLARRLGICPQQESRWFR